MSFAFPMAFTFAALALPIVALYILKVRLRRVPVSTNLFWKQIYDEKPPRSIWQHFRHLLSLLLQLLLLLFIVLAIADPYFPGQLLQTRRLVIVIDNSASMRAADVAPSRLETARRAALEIVEGLRFRDEVAVVLAGSSPEVIIGMTGHVPTLRDAINSIPFSDNPTSLDSAIALGLRLIGRHPNGTVFVMTDGAVDASQLVRNESKTLSGDSGNGEQALATARTKPPNDSSSNAEARNALERTPVEYRLFGSDGGNIGITQLQVRRSLVDPIGYEILVSVKNASAVAVSCRLELLLDDLPIDVIPLTLQPEELWSRSLEKTSLAGGKLHAVLTQISADSDLLSTDNSAWALLPERKTQRVLIVSSGNLFLQKVFEANPLVEVSTRKDFPEQWPADSIIVLNGIVPSILPDGNVFVIDPIGSCDQWEQGATLDNPIVTDQDKTSPLMNHIRMDNVMMPEAKQLKFRSPPHSLAKTLSGDSVYAEVRRPNGKCLVLSVNLDRSDLAFRTAFPIMVANSLGWFSGHTGELQQSLATGSLITLLIEHNRLGAFEPTLMSPSQKTSRVSISTAASRTAAAEVSQTSASNEPRLLTIGPFDEVGVWSLMLPATAASGDVPSTRAGSAEILASVAVNLTSERETDLRTAKELAESPQTRVFSEGWFSRPLWFYLIVLACCLTSLEWFLYQRRLIS